MKPITTKLHGFLDYIVGILFIAMPWILKIDPKGYAGVVFIVAGIAALFYSLLTRYELGAVKLIPMKTHLAIDMLSGILLASSPWIFDFADSIYLPHLIGGITEIVVVLLTRTAVDADTTRAL